MTMADQNLRARKFEHIKARPYISDSVWKATWVAAADSARLSQMRYRGGATGYLEVLTNETVAFSAELGLAQARLNELLALAQLYEALGGGYQQ